MRTTVPVSPEAMRHLDLWVPRHLRVAAWEKAFDVYIRRATTTYESEITDRAWAAERANRFWPIYIPEKSPYN